MDEAERLGAARTVRDGFRRVGEAARPCHGVGCDERVGAQAAAAGGRSVEAVTAERMRAGDGRVFEVAAEPGLRIERAGGGWRAVGVAAGEDAVVADAEELGIAQRTARR